LEHLIAEAAAQFQEDRTREIGIATNEDMPHGGQQ
jgi:hypothetical protein